MVKLGHKGEGLAVDYLKQKGYSIIQRNFKTSLGEIDIIAKHEETLVFIEVKTRESLEFCYF
jgi:putative endonuclease